MEKAKKEPKLVNILKEDKQAFGSRVGTSTTAEEAHSYPLTSVPLALASHERGLRQGAKSSLRNHLIAESSAMKTDAPLRAEWIVDGMAVVRSVPSKYTWGEYAEALLKHCIPNKCTNPQKLIIVMDIYGHKGNYPIESWQTR